MVAKRILPTMIVALPCAFVAPLAAHANLVIDGSFDSPSGGGSFVTYSGGASMGPWTVTGASVDLIGSYWQAPTAGGGSVDLDGNSPGGLTQNLTLSAGAYTLSFFLSGNPDNGAETNKLLVSVGDQSSVLYQYTTGANSHSNMDYLSETLNFTTTGPTTLSFLSGDASGGYGPVIGGVSVVAAPSPRAGAGVTSLIGLALAAIATGRRRQLPR